MMVITTMMMMVTTMSVDDDDKDDDDNDIYSSRVICNKCEKWCTYDCVTAGAYLVTPYFYSFCLDKLALESMINQRCFVQSTTHWL